MTQHTQGGWNRNIKPASKYPVVYAGRNTHVATVSRQGLSEEEIEANINLIAAAPDMLAALEEAETALDLYGDKTKGTIVATLNVVRQSIAKARATINK